MLSILSLPMEELTCPVCRDIFKQPVILSCSHSMCRTCLQEWWRKKAQECPVCGRKDLSGRAPCNLALKNLCESIDLNTAGSVSAEWKTVCSLHSEEFKLFCLDHQQPVCLVCRDSKRHTDHRFRRIDEAAQDLREELQKSLKITNWKLKIFNQVKEMQMQNKVIQLPQFLKEQKEVRITALVNKSVEALSNRTKAIEENLCKDDVSILQRYKNTVELLVQTPLPHDPQMITETQTDVSKELDNLILIWDKAVVLHSF